MDSTQNHKFLYYFLLGILCHLSTLSSIHSIATTVVSANKTTVNGITEPLIRDSVTNDQNLILPTNQLINGSVIRVGIQPESQESNATTRLISEDKDINKEQQTYNYINNNNINNKSPEDQLTELSIDQIITPSIDSSIAKNDISTNLSQNTYQLPALTDSASYHNNSHNNVTKEGIHQTNITSIERLPIPLSFNNIENLTTQTSLNLNGSNDQKRINNLETHRNKRSFFRRSLHSNLDELLNMKRQRRASMRSKRNTNYEDLLASLLAAEEAKYEDQYPNTYPSSATNELNSIALNYILNNLNSEDSDNKYSDLDKLSQYYYENLLPLIDNSDSDSSSTEENASQEQPIVVQPFSQPVIPVIPYSMPNRYQRIRRSYYNRYRNPISLYTGLKRKRNYNNYKGIGEWGRIVGADNDRSAYEDEALEANKIYALATLLATGNTPEEYERRYKRSVRSLKPISNIKNM